MDPTKKQPHPKYIRVSDYLLKLIETHKTLADTYSSPACQLSAEEEKKLYSQVRQLEQGITAIVSEYVLSPENLKP